jgi:hypothetical protein
MTKPNICARIDLKFSSEESTFSLITNQIEIFANCGIKYVSIDVKLSIGLNSNLIDQFDETCRSHGISWFPIISSIHVLNFMRPYHSKWYDGRSGYNVIIPSKCVTDTNFLRTVADTCDRVILNIGIATQEQIDSAISASFPDIVVHEAIVEPRLRYIQYLDHISSEFEKKYQVGFASRFSNLDHLLVCASFLGAKYIEYPFCLWDAPFISKLINSIQEASSINNGYGAREISKAEKKFLKNIFN